MLLQNYSKWINFCIIIIYFIKLYNVIAHLFAMLLNMMYVNAQVKLIVVGKYSNRKLYLFISV